MRHFASRLFPLVTLVLAACDPGTPPGTDAPRDSVSADPCAIHTTCETCAEEMAGTANCDWCAGSCRSRPAGVDFDDDTWCEWGHASNGGRCTEVDGVRIEPTLLPLDCRHSRNETAPGCTADVTEPGMVGDGPEFPASLDNGFVDAATRTVYVAASASISGTEGGLVYAVDLDTGDRTVVSGTYEDPRTGPMTVGTGPALTGWAYDVQRHPSGDLLYWGDAGLFRIDASGNRTQVRDGATYCVRGDWDWNYPNRTTQHAMAVDATGRAIVPTRAARDGSGTPPMPDDENFGIAALDGASCTYLSFASMDARFSLGAGRIPLGPFVYPVMDGSSILISSDFGRFFRVDPATGDRVVISAVQDGVGDSGPHDARPGDYGFVRRGDSLFAVRGEALSAPSTWDLILTEIDVATGDVTPHFNATELAGTNRLGLGRALWIAPHPDHADWFVIGTDRFLAVAELSSGNVNVLSY